MNKLLLPLLILIPNVVFGQLTGNVSDENTGEPLAFATVSFESLSRGTITNEDGFFKLSCSQTLPDTLRVSFIGYQPLRLPIAQRDSVTMDIKLKPSTVEIPLVVINGSDGTAPNREMKIFKKWQETKGNWGTKMYMTLTSEEERTPVEVVEACFNGKFYGNNLLDLSLKGGRLGVHTDPKYRFVNLNTTDVLLKFSLKPESSPPIPHPAVQKKKQWKSNYYWDLLAQYTENGDTLRRWKLVPDFPQLASCEVVFNLNDETVLSYSIRTNSTLPTLLKPVVEEDEIASLNLRMEWRFDEYDQRLQVWNFEYEMGYRNASRKRDIHVEGFAHAYDKESLFPEAMYSGQKMQTDYEKLLVWSFDPEFWAAQEIVPASKKAEEHRAFFECHGHLTNVTQLGEVEFPIFRCIPGQLNWNHFKGENGWSSNLDKGDIKRMSNSSRYALSCEWFINPYYDGDTCKIQRAVVFDGRNSFYQLENDSLALVFVNTYAALVEIEQARLIADLQQQRVACETKLFRPIWSDARARSKMRINRFLREVDRGENEDAFRRWQLFIREEQKNFGLID